MSSYVAQINGTTYPSITAALSALATGQTLQIATSMQGGDAFGTVNGPDTAVVTGVPLADGSYPVLTALGTAVRLAWGKAIINVESSKDVSISRLELDNAAAPSDSNGAGVRQNPDSSVLRLQDMVFRGCEDGFLGHGTETHIYDCLFDNNGHASSADRQGYSHNVYSDGGNLTEIQRSTAQFSEYGHDWKCRAKTLNMTQALAQGSKAGRALDYANGGIWNSKNSAYIKSATATQNNLVHLCAEGNPDGRPESYTSMNDLFQIDIDPASGRALQFICNDGNVECVLTDPKFVLNGVVLTDDQAKAYFAGKSPVRIVATGGVRGPLATPGRDPNAPNTKPSQTAGSGAIAATQPTPAVAIDVSNGSWADIGMERGPDITVPTGTVVRYGDPSTNRWIMKVVSGTFTPSNDFFGTDPASGIQKTVQKFVPTTAAAITQSPAPTPIAAAVTAPAASPVAPVSSAVDAVAVLEEMLKAGLIKLGYTVSKN